MYTRTDTAGYITEVSTAFAKLTGYTKQELIGKTHKLIRHPNTPNEQIKRMYSALAKGETWSGEFENITKHGNVFWVEIIIEPVYDSSNNIESFTGFYQDITDKKRVELLSNSDALTGVANRRKFEAELDIAVARANRWDTIFSIILLDIDHFKRINDRFGHDVGDNAIVALTKILKDNVRKPDLIARWGGEEFVILSTDNELQSAMLLAEKLRTIVAEYNFWFGATVTASFGVTTFTKFESKEKLFSRVDQYLCDAKAHGRNRVNGGTF